MSGASGGNGREYLIEFIDMGHAVRVAAIDVETGEEVVIQAPKSASEAEMKRVAVAKLDRKLGLSGQPKAEKKRPGTGPGRGIKV
ncbi:MULTISPECIES: DUF6898 family protein [Hyphobacterium]|uniref:DUF6898 family protein n=1 Tax=Hyphobacterium vulgare TaxID=1736751 RepID=A0ABV6ZTE3_9PROT